VAIPDLLDALRHWRQALGLGGESASSFAVHALTSNLGPALLLLRS
jgi:hypothetical protein